MKFEGLTSVSPAAHVMLFPRNSRTENGASTASSPPLTRAGLSFKFHFLRRIKLDRETDVISPQEMKFERQTSVSESASGKPCGSRVFRLLPWRFLTSATGGKPRAATAACANRRGPLLAFTYNGKFGTIRPAPVAGGPLAGVPLVRRFPDESSWVMEDVLFSKECLT
jgi:hypothetical protein